MSNEELKNKDLEQASGGATIRRRNIDGTDPDGGGPHAGQTDEPLQDGGTVRVLSGGGTIDQPDQEPTDLG